MTAPSACLLSLSRAGCADGATRRGPRKMSWLLDAGGCRVGGLRQAAAARGAKDVLFVDDLYVPGWVFSPLRAKNEEVRLHRCAELWRATSLPSKARLSPVINLALLLSVLLSAANQPFFYFRCL